MIDGSNGGNLQDDETRAPQAGDVRLWIAGGRMTMGGLRFFRSTARSDETMDRTSADCARQTDETMEARGSQDGRVAYSYFLGVEIILQKAYCAINLAALKSQSYFL